MHGRVESDCWWSSRGRGRSPRSSPSAGSGDDCTSHTRIDGAVAEIYDTAAVPGVMCGMSLGLGAGELATFVTTEPDPA